MGEARDDPRIFLVDPELRGVIDPAYFHIPRRLARTVRADLFDVSIDTAFHEVVKACALPRVGRMETWINAPIRDLYGQLFQNGHAHSVECRKDGELVGGLYGVSIGGAFFGESMFSTARDASKVALVHLVARLCAGGYSLLDCQFLTEHLTQFGTREITKHDYKARLASAVRRQGTFNRLDSALAGDSPETGGGASSTGLDGTAGRGDGAGVGPGSFALQAISHAS
jgi:leucyl/phenylalanyl-tRNA--protein transferase